MFSLTGESGVAYQVDDAPFNVPDGRARLHQCRDGAGRERVIKLYPAPITDPQAAARIRTAAERSAVVVAEAEAAGTVGETPETTINLPIDVLADGPGVIGVVLPAIPRAFLYDGRPRTFDELSPASARPPDAAFRVGLMIRVGEIFAVLEETGPVHGDVSPQNVLWRPDQPDAYLINWNGLRPAGPGGDAGSQDYADPRLIAQQIPAPDAYSDRYGLAVLMYHCLLLNPDAPLQDGHTWNPAAAVPGDLDPRLRSLFDRAFGDPYATDARPAAGEWRDALRGAFADQDGHYRPDAIGVLERHSRRPRDGATAVLGGPPPGAPSRPQQAQQPPQPPQGPGPYPGAAPQPPPYGPGPQRRSGTSPVLIAAAIGIPVVVIIMIVAAAAAFGVIPGVPGLFGPKPTPVAAPTTPDPYASPTTTDPYASPTATDPYDDPTTYSPPPDYNYGAIAVAHDGSTGKSWDYDTAAAARRRALNECTGSGCKILIEFVNGCGAIAYNPSTNMYWGGRGDTKSEAKRNAISHAGGGHWTTWVCTTR